MWIEITKELTDKLLKASQRKESYSSISLMKQCPYRYFLKYVQGNYANGSTIALEIGNLCHKIMELKMSPSSREGDYDLKDILMNGYFDGREKINGITQIKEIYFEDWVTPCRKSGLTYSEKLKNFEQRIDSPKGKEWEVVAVELPFDINYNGITLSGKIDKIEKNKDNQIKITDYKTSDAVYEDKDLKTPLQMFIYAEALKQMYGIEPSFFEYDFLLLGEKRAAMSKGWQKRGETALNKLLDNRTSYFSDVEFVPNPSPLCYWCDYCQQSCTTDTQTKGKCNFFSLWTPTNKTYSVNDKYEMGFIKKEEENEFIW